MTASTSRLLFAVIVAALSGVMPAGCAPQLTSVEERETTPEKPAPVSADADAADDAEESSLEDTQQDPAAKAAAELAARLANERCEQLYGKRPFRADQHPAVLRDDQYHWGGLDVAGYDGFSAYVTFGKYGSDPEVKVYLSTDSLDALMPALDLTPEIPRRP